MADETRTIIIDVEVDKNKEAEKKLEKSDKLLESNKKQRQELNKEIKKSNVVTDKQIQKRIKLEAQGKRLNEIRQKAIKTITTESNSLNALRLRVANLTKARNNLDTSTKEGTSRFKELNKEILNNTNKLKEAEQAGGDFRRNIGNYSSALDKVIPGLGGVVAGIQGMTKAALAFIATPLGLILAAVALAVTAVRAAFTQSEEGQNKFNKIMGVINVVLGNFRDLLADVGDFIIEAFENPQESILAFGRLIRDNIINRFKGILELVPALIKAVKQLFDRDFSGAAKTAADAVGKVVLGVESVTDSFVAATKAVAAFVTQTEEEIEIAKKVADARALAFKLERKLILDRSKLEAEIARLRLKARQEETIGGKERRQALVDAQVLQDQLLKQEIEVLELRAFAQREENKFARSTIENKLAEAEADAAIFRIEAARVNAQRQVQRELIRINGQIRAEENRIQKAKQKEFDSEISRIQKLAAAEADAHDQQVKNELALLRLKQDAAQQVLFGSLRLLTEGVKRNKSAAFAVASINVAEAITKSLTGAPAPFNFILAGLTAAAGIKQLNNIKNTKPPSEGDVNVSVPSGRGTQTSIANVNASLLSQFSTPVQNQADQNAALFAGLQNLPGGVVAVVDINTAQEKRAVKVGEAELG